ncbi:MAG: hypothetical protein K6G85_03830 [Eubacterium sp.]|nr:hypothetical protein [Eubacterium sp.]
MLSIDYNKAINRMNTPEYAQEAEDEMMMTGEMGAEVAPALRKEEIQGMKGKMNLDEFKQTIAEVTLDSFIEECKIRFYKKLDLDEADECDAKKFEVALVLESLMDEKFGLQMNHLSTELLAELVFTKLTEEK